MINYYTYSLRINHESKSNDTDEKNYKTDNENKNSNKIINNIIKKIINLNDDNTIIKTE